MTSKKKKAKYPYIIVSLFSVPIVLFLLLLNPFYPLPKDLVGIANGVGSDAGLQLIESRNIAGENSLFAGGCIFEIDLKYCPQVSARFYSNESAENLIAKIILSAKHAGFLFRDQYVYPTSEYYACTNNSCEIYFHKPLVDMNITIKQNNPPFKSGHTVYVEVGGTGPITRELNFRY